MALCQIAKVLKSNGTDGGLLLGFRDISLDEISLVEPVFIYFDGLPVPFFILDLTQKGTNKAIVHLNDIQNLKDAEEVVGQAVWAEVEEDENEDEDFSALIGWTLKGAGTITDFIDIPANPCLEVKTKKGTVLVPLHEDLIIDVDSEHQILELEIPDGLL